MTPRIVRTSTPRPPMPHSYIGECIGCRRGCFECAPGLHDTATSLSSFIATRSPRPVSLVKYGVPAGGTHWHGRWAR